MKYKHLIQSAFQDEAEQDAQRITALEKKILAAVAHAQTAPESRSSALLTFLRSLFSPKMVLAVATVILVVLVGLAGAARQHPVTARASLKDTLLYFRHALQRELGNLLSTDPEYRDKAGQKYQHAQQEWCAVSARSPEEQAQAVAAIRDFLDRPDAVVKYECLEKPTPSAEGQPQTETYLVDFDRFTIDIATNRVIAMAEQEGTWGYNKDGSRWFSPTKPYDYTPRYTQAQAEQLARVFIKNHEQALGPINLDELTLETNTQGAGTATVSYFFTWRPAAPPTPAAVAAPHLTIAFTQGGQLLSFSNQLSR